MAPFAAATARLVAAFPQCPPYGGVFPQPVPHLTLDRRCDTVDPATVRAAVGGLRPGAGPGRAGRPAVVGQPQLPRDAELEAELMPGRTGTWAIAGSAGTRAPAGRHVGRSPRAGKGRS